jgi:hypothetical protein
LGCREKKGVAGDISTVGWVQIPATPPQEAWDNFSPATPLFSVCFYEMQVNADSLKVSLVKALAYQSFLALSLCKFQEGLLP